MTRNRSRPLGLCLGLVVFAVSVTSTIAAVQDVILSVDRGAPGTSVSLHVEMSFREGTQPGTLYFIPQAAFDVGPFNRSCDQVPGTVALGDMAFHRETVQISAWTGDGYVGDLTFKVPSVATGAYYLSVAVTARGDGCHIFGLFNVTTAGLPDTALPAARF